jgi:outer membrane lipoprotein-sorting protein
MVSKIFALHLPLVFLFPGATGQPSQELPHPSQLSDFLNDFNDFDALITK